MKSFGQRPICGWCEAAVMTVHHSNFECQELQHQQDRIMVAAIRKDWNMRHLLGDGCQLHLVLEFVRMVNIFGYL